MKESNTSLNILNKNKLCKGCNTEKKISVFGVYTYKGKLKVQFYCKVCRKGFLTEKQIKYKIKILIIKIEKLQNKFNSIVLTNCIRSKKQKYIDIVKHQYIYKREIESLKEKLKDSIIS